MKIQQALLDVLRGNGIIKYVDIGPSSLNKGVLTTDKLGAFIQAMKEGTVLLDAARLIPMSSFKKDIDRISMDIELEAPVRDANGNEVLSDQDPAFGCNTLDAVKLRAKTRLTNDALEDNIEQGNLQTTLTSLFGTAGGRAWERVCIYGDTSITDTAVPTGYRAVNGWIKKNGNKLYGSGTGKDFDPSITDPTNENHPFAVMLDAQDDAYLENACYWVPKSVATKYQRSLKSKDTNLGDQANLQKGELTFEGYPVRAVPALGMPYKSASFMNGKAKKAWFFGPADQFVYGIWKNVQIRPVEDVENDLWKFFMRMRGDCHFEDETKVVCALPETAET